MKLTFRLPRWLVPKVSASLEDRAKLTGSASSTKSYLRGAIEITTTVGAPPIPTKESDK